MKRSFRLQIEADSPFIITNKVLSEMDLYNNMTIKLISEIIDLTDGKQITMEYMTEEFIANITKMIQPLE